MTVVTSDNRRQIEQVLACRANDIAADHVERVLAAHRRPRRVLRDITSADTCTRWVRFELDGELGHISDRLGDELLQATGAIGVRVYRAAVLLRWSEGWGSKR